MKDMTTAYARIIKAEKQADGTLMVYGKATDDSLDIDQQICDAGWLERAMPEWFKSGGNIREQHSNIAAGVAKEYEPKEDGHYINTLIVDPVSVKKVEAGVLKGFSIGIKAPRVVRDAKAANGRIIDGQIIEVSLVDRPANPNAKLMLAKTVKGKKNLVKVEEFVAKSASELIAEAKQLSPEIKKFDAAAYEMARRALAQLIVVEATEMAEEGHNEEMSISHLLSAVSHLFAWYEGEEAEGEVREEIMERSATKADDMEKPEETKPEETKADDTTAGCDCDGCMACKSDGGCDGKMCKGHSGAKTAIDFDSDPQRTEDVGEAEKSSTEKCLECGCHQPANSHGREDVSTAEMVSEKSAEEEKPAEEVKEENKDSDAEEVSEKSLLTESVITDILEKAVKSATDAVKAEIELVKSAKVAVENELDSVKADLAKAQTLAVAGGPKRTAIKSANAEETNDYARLANEYTAKAAQSSDPELAKGYRELAKEFLAKAVTKSE